jgi:hypothetical protein
MDNGKPSWYDLLPVSMRTDYDRIVSAERLSNESELGLYSVRLGHLLQRLEGGGPLANVSRLREIYLAMVEARVNSNDGAMGDALDELDTVLNDTEAESGTWQEIFKLLESKSRITDKEMKAKKSISTEKAEREKVAMLERFFEIIRVHVTDREVMKRLAVDIETKALQHVKGD